MIEKSLKVFFLLPSLLTNIPGCFKQDGAGFSLIITTFLFIAVFVLANNLQLIVS